MIDRRTLLAGLAAGAAAGATQARAQSYKQAYPELVLAVVPAENASGVTDRWAPFTEYLSAPARHQGDAARRQRLRRGHRGPARRQHPHRLLRPGLLRPRPGDRREDHRLRHRRQQRRHEGLLLGVLRQGRQPYKTIEDLKGKDLGLVDPNSTSGYNMPLFALNKLGINAETVLLQGADHRQPRERRAGAAAGHGADLPPTGGTRPDDSNLTRMLNKGMIKNADGKPATVNDFRIILKSDLIINSPTAYLDSLPDDLKAAIRTAYLDAAKNDKAAFDKLSDGKNQPWQTTDNAAYDDTIKLITVRRPPAQAEGLTPEAPGP